MQKPVSPSNTLTKGVATGTIQFPGGSTAHIVNAQDDVGVDTLLSALAIEIPQALVVITGGAGGMGEEETESLRPLFVDGLAYLASQNRIAILDGGTDSGVMKLMGEGAAKYDLPGPLIGVCPATKVTWPEHTNPEAVTRLEPHHSHFVLTAGKEFGTESEMIYAIADTLAEQIPSVALMVNGGPITYDEALRNVEQGREIIVLKGSGRAADAIADAKESQRPIDDRRVATIVRRGKITLFEVESEPEALVELLQKKLRIGGVHERR